MQRHRPRPDVNHISNASHWHNIDLLLVLIVYWSTFLVCQGAVSFVSQPRNQTVKEGDSIRFECSYQGSYLTPAWRINKTIYSHTDLPHIFMFNDQDFSLTVSSVPSSLNFTSFECIVGTVFSNRGYLHVEVDREKNNITECEECFTFSTKVSDADMLQGTTSLNSSVSTTVSTMPPTVNNYDVSHSLSISMPVLISVAVVVSTTVLLCMALCICALWMSSKTKPVSLEACQHHDIEVRDNEAYAAAEKYTKPIKVNNNPAYERTILNLSSKHQRCKSPQA